MMCRTAKDALNWLILIKEELGNEWLNNKLFRSAKNRTRYQPQYGLASIFAQWLRFELAFQIYNL
jgi:hypothetical protein